MIWVIFGILLAISVAGLGYFIYSKFSHINTSGCAVPDPDAKIISMKSEISGRKIQGMTAVTTVVFSDGFIFTSPKYHSMQNGLLSWHVFVDTFLQEEIAEDAMKAHKKFLQRCKKR